MVAFEDQGRCCPGLEDTILEYYFEALFTLNRLRLGLSGPFIEVTERLLPPSGRTNRSTKGPIFMGSGSGLQPTGERTTTIQLYIKIYST